MQAQRVPGPAGHWLLGHVREFQTDPLAFLAELRERHGDVAHFRLARDHCYLLSRPEHVRRVLRDDSQDFRKALFFDKVKVLLGNGLLSYPFEDDFWRRRRRLAQPPFKPASLERFADSWARVTDGFLSTWQTRADDGRAFDVFDALMGHSLDLSARTLLGMDGQSAEGERVKAAFTVCMEHMMHKVQHPLSPPELLPTPRNLRFLRARGVLDEVIYRLIRARGDGAADAPGEEDADDFLGQYLRANAREPGPAVSERQLRDDILTLFLAGFETNASAIAWTLWTVAGDAELQGALQREVAALDGRLPGLADLSRLPLSKRIVLETMRIHPPAWWIARATLRDIVVDGFPIPTGSTVVVSQYVTHRHPELWPEPERFDPDRFREEAIAARPPMAYFPFGDGPRGCIGEHFALAQLQLLLVMIAQRYRFSRLPGHRIDMWPVITMRPAPAVMMRVQRLQPQPSTGPREGLAAPRVQA